MNYIQINTNWEKKYDKKKQTTPTQLQIPGFRHVYKVYTSYHNVTIALKTTPVVTLIKIRGFGIVSDKTIHRKQNVSDDCNQKQ